MAEKLGVGIVGCGNIAGPYAENLAAYPQIELLGVTDIDFQRAQSLATKFNCHPYPSLEAMLADERIDLVVNLTIHHAHKAVVTQCLQAGKHVHSEKPLALTLEEAQALVSLAEARELRLGCSPFTLMGEGQQTAWKVIREGRLGPVRLVYAEVNWGRIESWHPAPKPFYQVGPLFDVGVYPLTLVTAILGPARQVTAYGRVLKPDRITQTGTPFQVTTPDFIVAAIELENGTLLRLTCNFYVGFHNKQQSGVEFHGDLGSLYLSSWHDFDGRVEYAEFGQEYKPVPWLRPPYRGSHKVEWGRAVLDMAQAITENRPHRATGQQAAHVVEIMGAISRSIATRRPVDVQSSFIPPQPMVWAMMEDVE